MARGMLASISTIRLVPALITWLNWREGRTLNSFSITWTGFHIKDPPTSSPRVPSLPMCRTTLKAGFLSRRWWSAIQLHACRCARRSKENLELFHRPTRHLLNSPVFGFRTGGAYSIGMEREPSRSRFRGERTRPGTPFSDIRKANKTCPQETNFTACDLRNFRSWTRPSKLVQTQSSNVQ